MLKIFNNFYSMSKILLNSKKHDFQFKTCQKVKANMLMRWWYQNIKVSESYVTIIKSKPLAH